MSTLLRSYTPTAATTGGGSVGTPFTDPDSVYLVREFGGTLGIDRISSGGDPKSPLLFPDTATGYLIAILVGPGRVAEAELKFYQPGDATTRQSYGLSVATLGAFALVANLGDAATGYLTGTGSSSLSFPARSAPTWIVAALQQVDATHVAVYADIRDADAPDVILMDGSSNPSKLAILTTDGPASSGISGIAGFCAPNTASPAIRAVKLWSYNGTITPGSGSSAGATNIPSLADVILPGRSIVRDADATTVSLAIDLEDTGDQTTGGAGAISYQLQSSPVSDKRGASATSYADVPGATGKTPTVAVTESGLFVRFKLTDSGVSPQVAYSDEVFIAPGPADPAVTGLLTLGDSYTANGSPPWPTTAARVIRNRQKLAACTVINPAIPFTRVEDWVPGHPGPLHPEFTYSYFDAAIVSAIRSIEAGEPINTVILPWGINDAQNAVTPQMYKDNLNFLLNGYDPAVSGIPAWWQNPATSTLALAAEDSATGYGPFAAGDARPGLLSFDWAERIAIVKPPYCQIVSVNANDILSYAAKIDEIVAANPGRVVAVDADGYQVVGGNTLWWSATDHLTQDGWDAMGERIASDLLDGTDTGETATVTLPTLTVTAVASSTRFTATGATNTTAGAYSPIPATATTPISYRLLRWLTGPNAEEDSVIVTDHGGGSYTISQPTRGGAIGVGDTATVV